MAGWNLSSGDILDSIVFEEEIWRAFNNFFSNNCRKQTTYKYGFLKAILDNLFSVEPTSRGLELSFQQLFDKFTENYWNLILKYNLKQAKVTNRVKYLGIERIILGAVHQYGLSEFAEYSSLNTALRKEIAQLVMFECQKNVVGAVYADFAGEMYGFDKNEGRIWLNLPFYAFLQKFKWNIEQENYSAWAKLLEKYNDRNVINGLLNKLEAATPKRHNLSLYRDILRNEFGAATCFYCHKKLTNKVQVDHVIPWQMVREDKLWNFVLACPICNASKNNRVPTKSVMHDVIERNDIILTYGNSVPCVVKDFENYTEDMMVHLWGYAKTGGFQEWQR